jgi:GntR family transcriptional regulator, transcriptional repressor for pyruvate dehydrogenase complex
LTSILTEPSAVGGATATKAKSTTGRAARRAPQSDGTTPDRVAEVLDHLTERIVQGEFDGDGMLPSEGDLAASFSVSRTVIREAMRGLRAAGLVEVSQGRAPRVKPPDSQVTVASLRLLLRRNKATLLHLAEVRRPLESEIAALAAERANDEHLRQLERAVQDLATASPLEGRIAADVRFHRILAEATGNPVFVLLLETLAEFLRESRQKTLAYSGVEEALVGHRAIFEAVRKCDSAKAREAMQEHLMLAARDLQNVSTRKKARSK